MTIEYNALLEQIMALPVFDTHTHLDSGWRQSTKGLYARNFFDICRYFWFDRELKATGYQPVGTDEDADNMDPKAVQALHTALTADRNSYWTRTVMAAMEDLYGIRPDSPDRIIELSNRMGTKIGDAGWGYQVCDKIGIQKTVIGPVGEKSEADIAQIKDRVIVVPHYSVDRVLKDVDPAAADVDQLKAQIAEQIKEIHEAGTRTVRAAWSFKPELDEAVRKDFSSEELKDMENLRQYLGHYLFSLYEEYGFTLQIFFGMRGPKTKGLTDLPLVRSYAQNNTSNVAMMHNIFEMYIGVNFELFCATELNSLDMVQAARIYPNVYPGGLWWFNFRRSVYDKTMQYRVEALPACRATLVASDARCIEWSYIKILLIKKIMTRFFHNQIREGWLDEDAALYTARQWLHDTAEKLYCPE